MRSVGGSTFLSMSFCMRWDAGPPAARSRAWRSTGFTEPRCSRAFSLSSRSGRPRGPADGVRYARSDLVYLATDAAPFVLTVVVGVPLLRGPSPRWGPAREARATGPLLARSALFGAALPIAFAPFLSLTGDYYEMGSIPRLPSRGPRAPCARREALAKRQSLQIERCPLPVAEQPARR